MLKKISLISLIVALSGCANQYYFSDDAAAAGKVENTTARPLEGNKQIKAQSATTQKKMIHNNSSKDAYLD